MSARDRLVSEGPITIDGVERDLEAAMETRGNLRV